MRSCIWIKGYTYGSRMQFLQRSCPHFAQVELPVVNKVEQESQVHLNLRVGFRHTRSRGGSASP